MKTTQINAEIKSTREKMVKAMEFIGTAIIITKKAKDLVVGDITALNGIVTDVTIDENKVLLTIKYPSGNVRAYIWDSSLIIRLK